MVFQTAPSFVASGRPQGGRPGPRRRAPRRRAGAAARREPSAVGALLRVLVRVVGAALAAASVLAIIALGFTIWFRPAAYLGPAWAILFIPFAMYLGTLAVDVAARVIGVVDRLGDYLLTRDHASRPDND